MISIIIIIITSSSSSSSSIIISIIIIIINIIMIEVKMNIIYDKHIYIYISFRSASLHAPRSELSPLHDHYYY